MNDSQFRTLLRLDLEVSARDGLWLNLSLPSRIIPRREGSQTKLSEQSGSGAASTREEE